MMINGTKSIPLNQLLPWNLIVVALPIDQIDLSLLTMVHSNFFFDDDDAGNCT